MTNLDTADPPSSRARWVDPRRHDPRSTLVAIVLVSTVARFGAALLVKTPLYFPDEYLYESLARGLAHGHFGEVRGARVPPSTTISYLPPTLTAPLWLFEDVGVSYRLTQLVGSIVFSAAALPAFAVARRAGVGPTYSLFVATLTLLLPAGLFSGAVMTEPYAYTAFLLVVLLAVTTAERPSGLRITATASSAFALILVGGFQFAPVLPALVVAGLVVARGRHRVAVVWGAVLFGALAALGARFASQGVSSALASKAELLHQPLGPTLTWLWINLFLLAVSVGWVTAPGALVGLGVLTRSPLRPERYLGVVSMLLVAGFLFEAAIWSSTFDRTYQRFAFYSAPLLLIAFARWAEQSRPRSAIFAGVGYGLGLTAATIPHTAGLHVDNPAAPPLTGLALHDPSATAVVWAPLLLLAAATTALAGDRRPRLVAAVAAVIALTAAAVAAIAVIHHAWSLPVARVNPPEGSVYVTTAGEDGYAELRSLFWNPQADRVAIFGGGRTPDGYPSISASLRPDGTIAESSGARLTGPFVASPATLAFPAATSGELAVFRTPIDVLAFGWYHRDGYLQPHTHIVLAGRTHGTLVRLSFWTPDSPKSIAVRCDGQNRRLTVDSHPKSLTLQAPPRSTRACDILLVAGTAEFRGGRLVGVRATIAPEQG